MNSTRFLSGGLIFLMLSIVSCGERIREASINEHTELDGLKAPQGFYLERAVDSNLVGYPMFASLDPQGRLFIFESDGSTPSTEDMLKQPVYFIRLLIDSNKDGVYDSSSIFADSLTYPKGGVFYGGSLYVSSSPDYLKLTDTDGNGIADKKEMLLTGWVLNHNGALLGGPFFGPDGWMYLTDARRSFDITSKEGKKFKGSSAMIWRCRPDGTDLEQYCGGGYDNAVEIAFMPSGETVGTMTYFTDPQGGFRDALMHWVEGGVYPKPLGVIEADRYQLTGDLMPVMTKTARVAPSGLMRYRNDVLGEEFTGNIFSAEFNTGRIMRHLVSEEGGTFKTDDQPFVTATRPDIHLTDILEDVDGSMLIVNTGGWFIAGCPLSRVAKTDIRGGIYRIRKSGTNHESTWINGAELKKLTLDEIASRAHTASPLNRDVLIEKLIESGDAAIPVIRQSLLDSDDAELRTAAIFALSRINTPSSISEVRTGLDDASPVVRTASARALGLARDKISIPKLLKLVREDKLNVRRQAATALGRMNDNRVTSELVFAAAGNKDRFVEHAIIYSLIKLNNPSALISALQNKSPEVQKAAVIALEQVYGSPIQKQHVAPLLLGDNPMLSNTAAWILTRQKGWPDLAIKYLDKQLSMPVISAHQKKAVADIIISFSGNQYVQRYLAAQLAGNKHKALITEAISNPRVKEMPAIWIKQLGEMLNTGDPEIYSRALHVIESRSIDDLNDELEKIVTNNDAQDAVRLRALAAKKVSDTKLNSQEFNLLLRYLSGNFSFPVKQQAARILSSSQLNNEQLLTLANKYMPAADVQQWPSLLGAFRGSSDARVGTALISALSGSPEKLENISLEELTQIIDQYPAEVKSGSASLLKMMKEKNALRLSKLETMLKSLKDGDVSRGRQIFFGKAQCSTCHAIENEGGNFGPDLTNIGEIRSQHDIMEAIIFPGASFAREYETSKVITRSTSHNGIIKEQFAEYIMLSVAPGQELRIERSDIVSIEPYNTSLMPPGLEKQLNSQELSDLLSYLVSLPDGMGGEGGE